MVDFNQRPVPFFRKLCGKFCGKYKRRFVGHDFHFLTRSPMSPYIWSKHVFWDMETRWCRRLSRRYVDDLRTHAQRASRRSDPGWTLHSGNDIAPKSSLYCSMPFLPRIEDRREGWQKRNFRVIEMIRRGSNRENDLTTTLKKSGSGWTFPKQLVLTCLRLLIRSFTPSMSPLHPHIPSLSMYEVRLASTSAWSIQCPNSACSLSAWVPT